ncbi:MAG TPA: SdrD B-like domain-containing protein [Caldilineaceae bacterium]|nr:SdrD B-like domain-containing protein [Caldilineaceae bacterium]
MQHTKQLGLIAITAIIAAVIAGVWRVQPALAQEGQSLFLPLVPTERQNQVNHIGDNPIAANWDAILAGEWPAPPSGQAVPQVSAAASNGLTAYTCLPTCSERDGLSLKMSGRPLSGMAGQWLRMHIHVPATTTSFELGVFDGDSGRDNSGAINPAGGNWDHKTAEVFFRLYVLDANGVATQLAEWSSNSTLLAPGGSVDSVSGTYMPNNAWWTAVINTAGAPTQSDGSRLYRLESFIDPGTLNVAFLNAFKVRSSANLFIRAGDVIGVEAALRQLVNDGMILYPEWQGDIAPTQQGNFFLTTPSTYDGSLTFLFDVPDGVSGLTIWDGDMDYGRHPDYPTSRPSGTPIDPCVDDDDSDTGNGEADKPSWAAGTAAIAEGAQAYGVPPDDNRIDIFRRIGCVTYQVISPNDDIYPNSNPSGNQEWEKFVVNSNQNLPAGVWTLELQGLDPSNSVYLVFDRDVQGHPSGSIGDFVWEDSDRDGVQDPLEPPLNDITVNLYADYSPAGVSGDGIFCPADVPVASLAPACGGTGSDPVIATQTTGTVQGFFNGARYNYLFEGLGAGVYWVRVVDSDPDLAGYLQTYDEDDGALYVPDPNNPETPATPHATKVALGESEHHRTADFGYFSQGGGQSGALIGTQVWYDTDKDGLFESSSNEPAIAGVVVRLYLDDGDNIFEPQTEFLVDSRITDSGTSVSTGNYLFEVLEAGKYWVVVDPCNFAAVGCDDPGAPASGALVNHLMTLDQSSQTGDHYNRLSPHLVDMTGLQDYLKADFGYFKMCTRSEDCYTVELLSVTLNQDGTRTYRWKVTVNQNCQTALSYVAFSVPPGVNAVPSTPEGNFTYQAPEQDGAPLNDQIKWNSSGNGMKNLGNWSIFQYTLPAGSDPQSVTVAIHRGGGPNPQFNEIFNLNDPNSCVAANLGGTDPEEPTLQGCTTAYWRQEQSFDEWVGYLPSDGFNTIFGVGPTDKTLWDALKLQVSGGTITQQQRDLAAQGTAGLLNAAHPSVYYSYTVPQVIALVQQGWNNPATNLAALTTANNQVCPLD